MSPSPPQPEFFVDRSLGRHAVPHALRADGWLLRTHLEVFGSRDEEVPDTEWLEFCGNEGLIVLTKDQRIRYRPAEIEVAARFAVRISRSPIATSKRRSRPSASSDTVPG